MKRPNVKRATFGMLALVAVVASSCGWASHTLSVTEFSLPDSLGLPEAIASGSDGALWFTESAAGKVGRITTSGGITSFSITEFSFPSPSGHPCGITSGPDGALWFTEADSGKVGRITTGGTVREFPLPTSSVEPIRIVPGPDGALWFTEYSGNRIGRITTGGGITEYPIPTPNSSPLGITSGPDGALWFTEADSGKVGRITTGGRITEFLVAQNPHVTGFSPDVNPMAIEDITRGPDGALWFVQYARFVGRITTTGSLTAISVSGDGLVGIVKGADSHVWFTEANVYKIGRINT